MIGVGIYFLLRWLKFTRPTNSKINTVITFIDNKLFYSGLLRYLIVSNLKLTYTAFGFFISSLAFTTLMQKGMTIGCGILLIFLLAYPTAQMYFLIKYQDRLEEKQVRKRFSTLFDGMLTDYKLALLYNFIFSFRRFGIVFFNITLSPNCPWSNFEQHRYLYKILIFMFIQSIYIIYIIESKPHIVKKFTLLELWNEGALMCLGYISLAFSGIVLGQSTDNLLAELLAYVIIAGIVIVNFYTVLEGTVKKLKDSMMGKKSKEIAKKKKKKPKQNKERKRNQVKLNTIKEVEDSNFQSNSSQSKSYVESESDAGDRKIPMPIIASKSEKTMMT